VGERRARRTRRDVIGELGRLSAAQLLTDRLRSQQPEADVLDQGSSMRRRPLAGRQRCWVSTVL
jgi:hypothetical protein